MTYFDDGSLQQLVGQARPAWLWDPMRCRIVWANTSGLNCFGCETLFDLMAIPFDEDEEGVAAVIALSSELQPGDSRKQVFQFALSGPRRFECLCQLHELADARTGVLLIGKEVSAASGDLPASIMTKVLQDMPIAVAVYGIDDKRLFANLVCVKLFDDTVCATLDNLLGSTQEAENLREKLGRSRVTAVVKPLETLLGMREIRITARRLQEGEAAADDPLLLMLEDVTEQRQLQKSLVNTNAETPPAWPTTEIADKAIEKAGEDAPAAADHEAGSQSHSDQAPLDQGRIDQETARKLSALSKAIEFDQPAMTDDREKSPPPAKQPAAALLDQGPDKAQVAYDELNAVIDTATDGVVILDSKRRILRFSAGAEALFGYRSAEVIGEDFVSLLDDDSQIIIEKYIANLADRSLASVFNDGREIAGVVKQGGIVLLFATIGRLGAGAGDSHDDTATFCVVLRDITHWKHTERQLREARERAEQDSEQKSNFLAQISHELRTPLNAILGFSEMMRTGQFGEIENERYRGYADDIHASGQYLLSLVNDLLDLSKVEAGKLELDFTAVELETLINEALGILQQQATAARVILRKDIASNLPNVVADLRSMKQILLNLIANAIKFTNPGGQVIIAAKLNKRGELVLKIKDTGIGMSEEQQQKAMQPFLQLHSPERPAQPGTGLGLPLTKALTEANRARFELSSKQSKGTLVTITFPTQRVLAG